MFKLVYSQKDTKASSFIINDVNKNIYVNNENDVILIDDKYNLKEYDYLLNSLVTFISSGNTWVANLNTGNTTIYNQDNIPIKTIDFIASSSRDFKNFSTEVFIYPKIYLNRDFKNPLYAKVSKADFNTIETYNLSLGLNGLYFVVNEDRFISKNNNKFGLFTFNNEKLWQHSYSELLNSEKAFLDSDILELNNKLFFLINGTDKGGLFCLDIETGKVLKQFSNMAYFLVKDENYIYTVKFRDILCKINPFTLEVEEWNVHELIRNAGFDSISDHRCVAQNGMIYFTQTLGDVKAKIGILDTQKKELVWKHDFEPENGGIGSIQVNENRIYIHTQDNTLHIFEKE